MFESLFVKPKITNKQTWNKKCTYVCLTSLLIRQGKYIALLPYFFFLIASETQNPSSSSEDE